MTAMQSPKLQVAQRRRRQGPFRSGIMIAASEKLFSMVGVDVFLAEGMSEQSQRWENTMPRSLWSWLQQKPWVLTMSDNGDYEGGTRGETTHKQHQETRVASSAIKQLPYKDYAQLLRSARDALRHKRPGQCPSLLKHPSLSYAKRKPVVACTYVYTSRPAQGGGGNFKDRKSIGEVNGCDSWMAERTDGPKGGWGSELSTYLSIYCIYLSTVSIYLLYLSIYLLYLSIYLLYLSIYLLYLSIYQSNLSIYLSISPIYLSIYQSNLSIYLSFILSHLISSQSQSQSQSNPIQSNLSIFSLSVCLSIRFTIYL